LCAIEKGRVELRSEHSGSNGVDADAVGRPFNRKRLCERCNRSFAGRIRGDLVERDERRNGRYVDNAAVAAVDHMSPDNLARAKRASQVRLQDSVPFIIGNVEGGCLSGTSRTIYKDLKASENLRYSFQERSQRAFVGYVASNVQRFPAQ